jgi:hypothetical protein
LAAAISQRVSERAMFDRAVRAGVERFKDDPNYRLDLVPSNFAPHKSPRSDDSAMLRRIVSAYQKSKEKQRSAAATFNVSNEWLWIYERDLGPAMEALSKGNVNELDRMYSNFFRDSCSTGLAGLPSNLHKKYFGSRISDRCRKIVVIDGLHRYQLWKSRTGAAFSVQDMTCPLVGNPYGNTIDGVFLRPGADYHHCYAQEIRELLPFGGNQVVAELGGGFGGMAYYLVRDTPGVTYINFDLPEAVALATYYLMKSIPNLNMTLYGEADLNAETLNKRGVVMMPSFEILKMGSKSVSVSFNSYSLAEMSPPAIRQYIAEITRMTSGHFLHVNHNKKAVLGADDFGVETSGFQLIRRKLAGWTSAINSNSDEFEYLYKAIEVQERKPA